MDKFDLVVAKKYDFIKDCPEHQVITWIESNGMDARLLFHRQIHDSLSFLYHCFQEGEYNCSFLSVDIWQELYEVYGITNQSDNSLLLDLTVDDIIERFGVPVMLSCDSYYLPYSKNFNQSHTGTRVIILKVDPDTNRYLIGEAPFQICEWVQKPLIQRSHTAEQPGRGYFHLPRLSSMNANPMETTHLVERLKEQLLKVLSVDSDRILQDLLQELPALLLQNATVFVLECCMHLQAGWIKMAKFLEWLQSSSGRDEKLIEEVYGLVYAWQRLQLDYVKMAKKPGPLGELLCHRLDNLRKQECSCYRSLMIYLQELKTIHVGRS
ncbi:hypothetical protein [Paenibacillus cymbidii]|uniref:hypothetical protein n=1 Tax=Paenibacillus cymbidii TaxID=1639034 RepID=UPI001080297F|nr:hypothetical protein [Paenibacillus cymbidii]